MSEDNLETVSLGSIKKYHEKLRELKYGDLHVKEKRMSEIEINEDNCVLDDMELTLIDIIFQLVSGSKTLEGIKVKFETQQTINEVFLKIHKLNEMAKEKQKNGIN